MVQQIDIIILSHGSLVVLYDYDDKIHYPSLKLHF